MELHTNLKTFFEGVHCEGIKSRETLISTDLKIKWIFSNGYIEGGNAPNTRVYLASFYVVWT